MKKVTIRKLGVVVASLLIPLCGLADVRVIGYMPSFKNLTATVDTTDLSKLTHINIAFLNPDAQGQLIADGLMRCMPGVDGKNTPVEDIHYLVDKAHQAKVQVLASVGGGVIPACSGDWMTQLEPKNRKQLVKNLVDYVEHFKLDGLDIDLEGALLTAIDNAGNYTPFIRALSVELKKRNKLLTSATASYEGGMVPVDSLPYFDFVNLMSYDAIGPSWGTPGIEHSTYDQAVAHIAIWKARGLTKDKLVLGVPFYGYGFGRYQSDYAYKDILAKFGTDATELDLIAKTCAGCSYITFNGKPTIQEKTRLALEEGAGVMIWEMSQDVQGEHSLLKVIDDEIKHHRADSAE